MIKKLLLTFSLLNNIDQNKAYFTVFSTSPLVHCSIAFIFNGHSVSRTIPMCPVVLFPIVNRCKSTQSLTARYKVIQKPIQKSYTSPWQAKPHLVNTHASFAFTPYFFIRCHQSLQRELNLIRF